MKLDPLNTAQRPIQINFVNYEMKNYFPPRCRIHIRSWTFERIEELRCLKSGTTGRDISEAPGSKAPSIGLVLRFHFTLDGVEEGRHQEFWTAFGRQAEKWILSGLDWFDPNLLLYFCCILWGGESGGWKIKLSLYGIYQIYFWSGYFLLYIICTIF